jgi:hypothetical protein
MSDALKIRQLRHKMASSPRAILPGAGQLARISGMDFEDRVYFLLESARP